MNSTPSHLRDKKGRFIKGNISYLKGGHHIDYNKKNSFQENCVSLCDECHGLTTKDRDIWKKHFQELLKKLYNYNYTINQKIILDFIGGDVK